MCVTQNAASPSPWTLLPFDTLNITRTQDKGCQQSSLSKGITWKWWQGYPSGSVAKNPPPNAGDVGLIPDLRKSHMPQSNSAHEPQLLSLCSKAWEPQLLSPRATTTETQAPRACPLKQEKPPQWEAHTPQPESSPYSLQLEKSTHSASVVSDSVTPEMAAQQAPPSLGFSRQEHWSGLPFPSPMHASEKWKWSRLVVSDS